MSSNEESKEIGKIETVSASTKRKRKFQWTDKRKEQFEEIVKKNHEKKQAEGKTKEVKKEEKTDSIAEQDDTETKKDKNSKNIIKRMLDPHFLTRKNREKKTKRE